MNLKDCGKLLDKHTRDKSSEREKEKSSEKTREKSRKQEKGK
jgi:hypothetical protein